ncbi:MAG: uroporphyrinogen-III C-methyltransferase, partial [Xanthomonadales bacterium]|nr:uroporphyrinogen-III C-methyltransferase [Xanthomonadales bacterium]
LLAAAALAGTGWLWWQGQQGADSRNGQFAAELANLERSDEALESDLQRLREAVTAMPDDPGAAIAALEQQVEARTDAVRRLREQLDEQLALSRSLQMASVAMQGRLKAAEAALAGLANRERDVVRDLDLAEVEYLLRLASYRLRLFSDVAGAKTALELADRQLAALDSPVYLAVRQDISAALRGLEKRSPPDFVATAGELDAAQQAIAALPFPEGETATGRPASGATGWWAKTVDVFSRLVTIRRSTPEEMEQLSLKDRDFIRQRFWLQLETARLALMRRDDQAFQGSLSRARETLSDWFDMQSEAGQDMLGRLQALEALRLEPVLPDISQPWQTLHALRQDAGEYRPLEPSEPLPDAAEPPGPPVNEPEAVSEPEAESEPAAKADRQ